jgi:hypothetical protein
VLKEQSDAQASPVQPAWHGVEASFMVDRAGRRVFVLMQDRRDSVSVAIEDEDHTRFEWIRHVRFAAIDASLQLRHH